MIDQINWIIRLISVRIISTVSPRFNKAFKGTHRNEKGQERKRRLTNSRKRWQQLRECKVKDTEQTLMKRRKSSRELAHRRQISNKQNRERMSTLCERND